MVLYMEEIRKHLLNEDKTLFIISIEVESGNLKTGDIITQTINKVFDCINGLDDA